MNTISTELETDPDIAAKRLLGCQLVRTIGNTKIICKIVETEAYSQTDPASHSYNGMTPRTEVMFGPAGRAYVYFTYGMHYCMNVVSGKTGQASAVLIRAVEPLTELDLIRANRKSVMATEQLTNGPAKLCQALQIDKDFNGHDLSKVPLQLTLKTQLRPSEIVSSERIGISKATKLKWRFYIKNNSFVSR